LKEKGTSVYSDKRELPFKKRMQNLLDAKITGEKIVFEKLVSLEKNIVLAHS
jgi:hypothetical protein